MNNNQINQCKNCFVPLSNQTGTALVTSLVMLLIMTMIGVGSLKNNMVQEKMAGNVWDAGSAFQATEISLRDAESYIETQSSVASFNTSTTGLLSATDAEFDYLDSVAWGANSARQSTGEFTAVKEPPYHVIKHVKDTNGPGGNNSIMVRGYDDVAPGTNVSIFKITAKGSGRTDSARSILQTYYAKRF
ncbi:MAG: PilX N-terminal domain-containing pilus assembly protein [Methylococcales bacterium]